MMRVLVLMSAALCLPLLGGCGLIYRLDVQQGNVIEQQQVDQLRPGMTRRQVALVMGTPAIADPFHQNRWDYVHSLRRGNGETEIKRFTVFFENGVLARTEGDFSPTRR